MKEYLKRFIESLGFITQDRFDEELDDAVNRMTEEKDRILDLQADVNIALAEPEKIYQAAVEINHRVKKLEEFVAVEYKVEGPAFIGYRKKSK